MTQNNKNYLDFLNNEQFNAVTETEGSLLILAGAGSGKTRVLTYKILHLLVNNKALPSEILAVTFTNKAASEMKNRVSKLLNRPIDQMWVGTFHSLSAKILRLHCGLIGLKSNFIIIDSDDQLKLIKQICEREKIDTKEKSPRFYQNSINNLKNKNIEYNYVKNLNYKKNQKDIFKIYKIYQEELLRLNCVDFGDLILHCIKVFKISKNDFNLKKQFKYILVDEYQDINKVQQIWLEYLYKHNKNICCVGDDDQSIYSWRGADVTNLLNFEKNFSKPKILRLEQNYRSTQNILKCASSLIKRNKGRYGKELWSKNDLGDKTIINGFWETKEEAMFVSDEIEKLISNRIPLNEISILFRVAAHTRSFEDRFINLGLPYKIIGGLRFYERKEIKDIIAYLRLVNNLDDNLAFERIINVPKRGIGKTTINKIYDISRINKISMFNAAKLYIDKNSNKSKIELLNFINKVIKWKKVQTTTNHIELAQLILDDSNYISYLENEEKNLKNPQNLNRIENIKEFIVSLKDFENLEGFLEHVSLVMENISNTSSQTISLMTMHSAKGLEFDYVFLAGWEEGVFPSLKSIDELGQAGLEEERRLAYVALTRARKKINITYVNQNRYSYASHDYNVPSRFIDELPKELIEINNSSYFNQKDFLEDMYDSDDHFSNELSPGRKRIMSNYKENDIDWDFNQDTTNSFQLREGVKVFHQKFGYGTILEIDGDKAEVKFSKSSQKKVFMKYLQKAS
tara:strand:+ start:3131 stop:5356 length:2226 start_codon:yes stop_codon:yes gene_type:complete